jgi:predicted ribonuclease YlaK
LLKSLIEKEAYLWGSPSSIEEAIKRALEKPDIFRKFLNLIKSNEETILLILDTNSLTIEPDFIKYSSIIGTEKFTILILSTVLGELDKLKNDHRNEDYRKKVKKVILRLKGYRKSNGSLLQGITITKSIKLKVEANEPNFNETLPSLDPLIKDDRIIASILEIQREFPSSKIIFVTDDLMAQIKAEKYLINFSEPPKVEVLDVQE